MRLSGTYAPGATWLFGMYDGKQVSEAGVKRYLRVDLPGIRVAFTLWSENT